MTQIHQHGLNRAIVGHLRQRFTGIKVDLFYDGYKLPTDRPLIFVEQMQNNHEIISKGREGVETTYRYQVALYDSNSSSLSINQERLSNVFLFDEFTYVETLRDSDNKVTFLCELNGVTPIRPDNISEKSGYNRVYFDIEIKNIKRRCI